MIKRRMAAKPRQLKRTSVKKRVLGLVDLARLPGIRWNSRKPRGLASAERMPRGVSLASWVAKNRR